MDFDLTALTRIAENAFRNHPDREEMVDRTVTLAWYRWGQLGEAGKLTEENWKAAVGYTIRQVRTGRTLEGATVRDVTDEAAQHRHGIKVEPSGDAGGPGRAGQPGGTGPGEGHAGDLPGGAGRQEAPGPGTDDRRGGQHGGA